MKRRSLLVAGGACCAAAIAGRNWAQAPSFTVPERFARPEMASDEGGLWAMMDREERNLRRSPFLLRDAKLNAYLQDIACRLGAAHCPDIRVHVVRTPLFNASMAPNGMMQVWTGLLLRVENEAQLAAVLGHEIGHFLRRHSLDRLRDMKAKSAFAQFLGVFGAVGAVGQLAVLASAFAYGRDHEREADMIGACLMHEAGFDIAEAAKVWGNLLDEVKAREGKEPGEVSPLFATHPSPPERRETLGRYAAEMPGGGTGSESYAANTERFFDDWLQDEVKRNQYAESLVLLGRLMARKSSEALTRFYRGEVYRLRAEAGDLDNALADYRAAIQLPNPPQAAYRGIGQIARQRGQKAEAAEAFRRYLELAPDAADAPLIKDYLSELNT